MNIAHRLALAHLIGMPLYHLGAVVLVFVYPINSRYFFVFMITYLLQAMGIALGYHRLFSHRSYRANRFFTFLMALFGSLAGQGALHRWVYHHRKHHQFTDQVGDPHSPGVSGFLRAYILWRFDPKSYENETDAVKISAEWPIEIRLLDRFTPALFFVQPCIFGLIGGWALVAWACLIPTVVLWQVTFFVNTGLHSHQKKYTRKWSSRLFETHDDSLNAFWMSFIFWGEGWHNNHHASPKNARLGIRPYQIDFGYYFLKLFEKIGFVHHMIEEPESKIRSGLFNPSKFKTNLTANITLNVLTIFALLSSPFSTFAGTPDPVEIMRREEFNNLGKTFNSRITMIIDLEGSPRTLEVAAWMQGYEKTILKVIKPEKDKNQGNLKNAQQLWQFLPKVDRIIKIPQSMMLQSWMGSDFSNDDLVKGSRLSVDYNLKLLKSTEVNQVKAYVIEALPKPNAPVVWGKVIETLTQKESAFLKREFYNEKQKLVKTMVGSELKTINGHTIPTVLTMSNHEKGNRKTSMQYRNIVFDQPISDTTFTQENLRKPVF